MSLTAAGEDFSTARARNRARGGAYLRARMGKIMHWVVATWIFLGGMVLIEPSPYEFAFIFVVPAVALGGVHLYRTNLPLLGIIVCFTPFAIIAGFQVHFSQPQSALVFEFVTIFLLFTAYVVANYVADDPQARMRLIVRAYTAIAVISAIIGTAAYLRLIPGGTDLFTKYGRAKGFFQDPNVFGPFLILPAMYALQRVLMGSRRMQIFAGAVFMILFIGVFASFSRAAWGHFIASSLIVFLLCFALEANARMKVKMLLLTMVGGVMLVAALAGLLSIPAVGDLFSQRASVEQNYDSGSTGRFGRQGFAFELALSKPLGIGPGEFRNMRVQEEPHDSYVSVLHVYGWGGGLCFYLLIIATLWRGFGMLAKKSPNRLLLIPLISVFIPLIVEAGIIDLDHWRHYYLVIGLIWGVSAGYQTIRPGGRKPLAGLV